MTSKYNHVCRALMPLEGFRFVDEEWTQAAGLLTPTLKLKRRKIHERYNELIVSMYAKSAAATQMDGSEYDSLH